MKKLFRLVENKDFSLTINENHNLSSSSYAIYFKKNDLGHARIGISTSKKLGNAVVRNRIRRQIRAMIDRIIKLDVVSYDVVIIVRKGFIGKAFQNNLEDLEKLITKIK